MRAILTFAAAAAILSPVPLLAQGQLENPSEGSIEAGVTAITGWHCTARQVELRIDGRSIGNAGIGTPRADTASRCGRSDTGFSLLYNYALLKGGSHRLDAYADGQLFATASFSAAYLGAEFMAGYASAHEIQDFPSKGEKARVQWSQAKQDFVVTGTGPVLSGSLVGTYAIRYFSLTVLNGSAVQVASSLQPGIGVSGTMTFNASGGYSMRMTMSANGVPQTIDGSGTYTDGGYYMTQDGAALAIHERGETLTFEAMTPVPSAGPAATGSLVLSMTRVSTKEGEAPAPAARVLPPGRTITDLAQALTGLLLRFM